MTQSRSVRLWFTSAALVVFSLALALIAAPAASADLSEEPIVANEHLWELVEETGSVELSRFTSDLHRYTFHWRRNVMLDDEDFARWFGMLSVDGVLSGISTVLPWPHDIAGGFRARHRFVEIVRACSPSSRKRGAGDRDAER